MEAMSSISITQGAATSSVAFEHLKCSSGNRETDVSFHRIKMKFQRLTLDSVVGKLESLFGTTRVSGSVFSTLNFYEINIQVKYFR